VVISYEDPQGCGIDLFEQRPDCLPDNIRLVACGHDDSHASADADRRFRPFGGGETRQKPPRAAIRLSQMKQDSAPIQAAIIFEF
jgi:hypothetical protein